MEEPTLHTDFAGCCFRPCGLRKLKSTVHDPIPRDATKSFHVSKRVISITLRRGFLGYIWVVGVDLDVTKLSGLSLTCQHAPHPLDFVLLLLTAARGTSAELLSDDADKPGLILGGV